MFLFIQKYAQQIMANNKQQIPTLRTSPESYTLIMGILVWYKWVLLPRKGFMNVMFHLSCYNIIRSTALFKICLARVLNSSTSDIAQDIEGKSFIASSRKL